MSVQVREKIKGSGDWWIFIEHHGQRRSKKIGRDKRFALEAAKKIEAKLILGDLKLEKNEDVTFGHYAKTWIENTVPATCKRISISDYTGILKNHVLPDLEKTPVTDISKAVVKKLLQQKLKEGYAASTATHIKNAISGVLELAVDDNKISSNPAQIIRKLIRSKVKKYHIDPLTREETKLLLETCLQHYPKHYPMLLTLCRTGMRLGEVIALQWGDIDFNNRFIIVRRSRSKSHTSTPKNDKYRNIDMSRQLTECLTKLKIKRKEEYLAKGEGMPEWIFISDIGTPLIEGHWRERVFKKLLEKAKIRQIRIHDIRHTYASQLIQDNRSLAYIKDQLGHHSIQVTVDIYGHLVPGANKEVVDSLDDPDYTYITPNLIEA
ncbi:MAG TPA: site-specific integrase [Smithella sp.]|nr:site-specific integrase [Smithella sp.]